MYTSFKVNFPFAVIAKYWLYSSHCIIYPWAYLTSNSLNSLLPHPYVVPITFSTGKDWFVFYVCDSAFFFFCYIHYFTIIFRLHISFISYNIRLSLSEISLNLILSESIHVVANDKISFLWLIIFHYIYCFFFIHSSIDGHLSFLKLLSVINSATTLTFWLIYF